MNKIILLIIIFFISNLAYASWSGFAHVTPSTEKEFNIDVQLIPLDKSGNKFLVKVKAAGYDHKLAWLVVTSGELSEAGQQLRSHIWESAKSEKEIILKTKLLPTGVGSSTANKSISKFYEVELDSRIIKNAYIYIDFPSLVLDGGYYYSIDLNAYLKHHQSSANKTITRPE